MKLTKEQRLEIGRRIYNNEITKFEAAEKYGISVTTARDYMRMYRDANHLPPKKTSQHAQGSEREATLPAATEPAGLEEIQSMTKDELINALIWERIDNTILKKICEEGECQEKIHLSRREIYEVIMELSGHFPVTLLCEWLHIGHSSFYYWKHRLSHPSARMQRRTEAKVTFMEYHKRYPSHGYRWLQAKIYLDMAVYYSPSYACKICKLLGIRSQARRCRYKKKGNPYKIYPNLLMAEMNINGPMECVVSDMTAFYIEKIYYELTLYMDLWNNEIIAYSLSSKRGDRMTYLNGLHDVIEFKKQYPDQKLILHSDQGSVYASKAYNELLPMYNITHSMSRAGTPTDNASMESINGWIKEELFVDFHITHNKDIDRQVEQYIRFFNEERPAYALGYLTPVQYREMYAPEKD